MVWNLIPDQRVMIAGSWEISDWRNNNNRRGCNERRGEMQDVKKPQLQQVTARDP
jgi:hypothetical protein